MAKLKTAPKKASTKGKTEKKEKKPVAKAATKKAEKTLSPKNSKQLGDESDEPAVAKPSKKKTSSKKKEKVLIAETGEHDDDLPPIESEDDAIISTIDVDEIAREVEIYILHRNDLSV